MACQPQTQTPKMKTTSCFRDMVDLARGRDSIQAPALQFLYNACAEMNEWETPSQTRAKTQSQIVGAPPQVTQSNAPKAP